MMTPSNVVTTSDDVESQVRAAMASHGIETTSRLIADGQLRRFYVEGDRAGSENGWYRIYADERPTAVFGSWKMPGCSFKWCASSTSATRDVAHYLEHVQRSRIEREQQELARQRRAALTADRLWNDASVARPDHEYLVRKNVRPFGIRQLGDRLVVPMRGADGMLRGLQLIDQHGAKRFLSGIAKTGAYHPVGRMAAALIVAEGYATAATLHELTALPVAVAFDCGNLVHVATAMRSKFPDVRIIIAGDDDCSTPGNPGRRAAEQAARLVGGVAAFPPLAALDRGIDWNDAAAVFGPVATREAFESLVGASTSSHAA